jgi:AcrR family transcriptional regulator
MRRECDDVAMRAAHPPPKAKTRATVKATVGTKPTARARAAPAARRNRGATEERILAAVGAVLARDGFAAMGVNAVAREAAVDKVLIYRYFGGLPELLQAWGASGRFWPSVSELVGDDALALQKLPAAERLAMFFDRFIDALRARPLTIEVLAAEVVERNELTVLLESERENWGQEVEAAFGGPELTERAHLRGSVLVLVAGLQYLLLRARRIRIFGGLDLSTDAGWQEIKTALRGMSVALLGPAARSPRAPRSAG